MSITNTGDATRHPAPVEEIVTGELITDEDYRRNFRPAPTPWTAPLALPVFVDDPGQAARHVGRALARVPIRFPGAVARGTGRSLAAWWRWVTATEEHHALLRTGKSVTSKDLEQLAALRKARRTATWWSLSTTLGGGFTLYATQGTLAVAAAAATGALSLAAAGRRPSPTPALSPARRPQLSMFTTDAPALEDGAGSEELTEAFTAAGIIKDGQQVRLVRPPHHDGIALTCVVQLPAGKTIAAVTPAKPSLASALGIDEAQLDVERVPGNARLVSLWIADTDPFARPDQRSPLMDAPAWDLWRPIPLGTDKRGRPVHLPLIFTSILVGSMPRMGKTVVLRLLAMAAALDATARLFIWDGKGGKDFAPLRDLAHGYGKGVRGDTVERLVLVLRDLVEEMNDRYERLEDLPDDICPDSKVTPNLTGDPSYGMGLTVIIIDEVQRYLEDPTHGAEILERLTDLAKVAPALGFIIILATQKPDAETIPDGLRAQLGTRVALRVMNWQTSEVILGTGTSKAGYNAATFALHHKGWALLRGAEDVDLGADILTIRTDFANVPDARTVAQRAYALRAAAGTLPTQPANTPAAAVGPEARVPGLLADIAALADAEGTTRLATTAIIAKLGLDLSAKALGAQLARWGCPVGREQINGREVRGPLASDIRLAVRRIAHGGPVEVARPAS